MGLDWTKTIKRALKDERVPMSSIHDLFKNLKAEAEPFRILVKGARIKCFTMSNIQNSSSKQIMSSCQ